MAFPTKILLATDGSKDATLADQDAIELSDQSGAELHVVYVGHSSLTQSPTEYRTAAQERLDELVTKVRMREGPLRRPISGWIRRAAWKTRTLSALPKSWEPT
jgi:nucleotide-binding universal stress UspA family protein